MGIFTRFKDIISSNINNLLDNAEDPEKMIRLMIREMEDTLVELKVSCASTMANQKKLNREIDENKNLVDRWEQRAQLAVDKNQDDLAREALYEKKNAESILTGLESELSQFDHLIKECQDNILQLEDKLEKVHIKHRTLIERKKHAEKKKRAQQNIRSASGSEAIIRFREFENRIEKAEAEAEIVNLKKNATLESKFEKLERDSEIEEELKRLKNPVSTDSKTKKDEK